VLEKRPVSTSLLKGKTLVLFLGISLLMVERSIPILLEKLHMVGASDGCRGISVDVMHS
jgi:hypothetical protein